MKMKEKSIGKMRKLLLRIGLFSILVAVLMMYLPLSNLFGIIVGPQDTDPGFTEEETLFEQGEEELDDSGIEEEEELIENEEDDGNNTDTGDDETGTEEEETLTGDDEENAVNGEEPLEEPASDETVNQETEENNSIDGEQEEDNNVEGDNDGEENTKESTAGETNPSDDEGQNQEENINNEDTDEELSMQSVSGENEDNSETPGSKDFDEISSSIITLIEEFKENNGKYPRSWGGYNYTDIGLNASDWEAAIDHIIYAPAGNKLYVEPEEEFGFEAVNAAGEVIRMPYDLKYNFIYNVEDGEWYYHKINPENKIDIATLKIYSTETGEIIPGKTDDKDNESEEAEENTGEVEVTEESSTIGSYEFPIIGFEDGGIDSNNGQNKGASGNLVRTPGFMEVKPGITYTVSGYSGKAEWPRIYFYDKDKNFISVEGSDTATVPENAAYARIRLTLKEAGQLPESVVFEGEGIEDEEDKDTEGKEKEDTGNGLVALSVEKLKEEGAVSPDFGNWSDNEDEDAIVSGEKESRIFINNPNDEYTIKTTASLPEGTLGGYGVFFDTTIDEKDNSKDFGYIVQFDRGTGDGAILIRTRWSGYEFNPVIVVKSSSDGIIPSKTENPEWWTAKHELEIKVTSIDDAETANNRSVQVYIDGKHILDFDYESEVAGQDVKHYTGFRAWIGSNNYYGIAINSIKESNDEPGENEKYSSNGKNQGSSDTNDDNNSGTGNTDDEETGTNTGSGTENNLGDNPADENASNEQSGSQQETSTTETGDAGGNNEIADYKDNTGSLANTQEVAAVNNDIVTVYDDNEDQTSDTGIEVLGLDARVLAFTGTNPALLISGLAALVIGIIALLVSLIAKRKTVEIK
jgi:hypothetical protein